MKRFSYKSIYILMAFFIPLVTFISPKWPSLAGVGPRWEVFWLLPWALEEGPISGAIAGLLLGLVLDAISLLGPSQIPSLIVLGFWWGRLGNKSQIIQRSFNLGLLAWIGSLVIGLSFWLQKLLLFQGNTLLIFNSWALHTLFSQSIITGLIAPMICSWMLLFFFKR